MIKSLVKHGNSSALIIEKPILSLLGATPESEFDVVTDGKSLILTPVQTTARRSKFREGGRGKNGKTLQQDV